MKLRLVLSIALVAMLAGCIPLKPPPGEKPFRNEQMSFVRIGETTREEVLDRFASLDVPLYPRRFEEDSVWVYQADRDTWQWLVCVGAGYSADCGIVGMMRSYFMKFEFDEAGRVADWNASSTLGECSTDGICEESEAIMVFGDDNAGRQASIVPTAGMCEIFVFATTPRNVVVSATLNDLYIGSLISDSAFIHMAIPAGTHRARTLHCTAASANCNEYGINSQTISVDCRAHEQVYLHHNGRHKERRGRQFVLEQVGRGGVADRRRVLNVVPGERRPAIATDTSDRVIALDGIPDLVWQVQLRLKDRDLYTGRIDGAMNEDTQVALRKFREMNGLQGGGLLDDNTLMVLGIYDQ